MSIIRSIIIFLNEKKISFTLNQTFFPITFFALAFVTYDTRKKCLEIENSNTSLRLEMGELLKQSNKKDKTIERLITQVNDLKAELVQKQEDWFHTNQSLNLKSNTTTSSTDVLLAQHEMTKFWVTTCLKTLLVISLVAGGYYLYKGFSVMSIFKIPVYALATITNYFAGGDWFTGTHKFFYHESTGSSWLVKLTDEKVTDILVRLYDSQRFVSATDFIVNNRLNFVVDNVVNQTAIIAANPETTEVITSVTDALFKTVT